MRSCLSYLLPPIRPSTSESRVGGRKNHRPVYPAERGEAGSCMTWRWGMSLTPFALRPLITDEHWHICAPFGLFLFVVLSRYAWGTDWYAQ
jgi:hypothetical protein